MDGLKLSPKTPEDHQHNLRVILGAAVLSGRLGGQILYGGKKSGEHLELHSNPSKNGLIKLGDGSAFNEANGRLGIGTLAPASPLSFGGGTVDITMATSGIANAHAFRLFPHTEFATSEPAMQFWSSGSAFAGQMYFDAGSAGAIFFRHATTERMRVDGNAAANQTGVQMAEGSPQTLRRVQWKAGNALVAGDKVMVLV